MPSGSDPRLWQGSMEQIEGCMIISLPHPIDNDIVKAVFSDLFLVGERPSVSEVSAFLERRWPGISQKTRRRSLSVWKTLEKNPLHRFRWERGRGRRWPLRPFDVLDRVVDAHGLQPVGERLIARISKLNEELLALAGSPFDLDVAARIDRELLTLQDALRVYVANRSDIGLDGDNFFGRRIADEPSLPFNRRQLIRLLLIDERTE